MTPRTGGGLLDDHSSRLDREIELYSQALEQLETIRARCGQLRVAVFSRDHAWSDRLAVLLRRERVYHVNGQGEFPLPDVVIAEDHTGPLTRAATVVELRASHQVAEVGVVEQIRLAAQQTFDQPFRYGFNVKRFR